jgi:hypothetical protein
MLAEENMALARHFMEARVKGDVDALEEMLPPDFISHTKLLPEEEQGREGVIWAAAQGGHPLHRALHPRSRGDYGPCA